MDVRILRLDFRNNSYDDVIQTEFMTDLFAESIEIAN